MDSNRQHERFPLWPHRVPAVQWDGAGGRRLLHFRRCSGYSEPVSEALTSSELWNPTTGEWTLTGNMVNMHAFHTANVLSSGNVLVEGGTSLQLPPGPETVSASEVYNPSTATWTAVGNLNTARYYAASSLFTGDQVSWQEGMGEAAAAGSLPPNSTLPPANHGRHCAMSVGAYSLAAAVLSGTQALVSGGYSCCSTPNSTINTALIFGPATQSMVAHSEHVAGTVWAYDDSTQRRHGAGGRRNTTRPKWGGDHFGGTFLQRTPAAPDYDHFQCRNHSFFRDGHRLRRRSYITPTTLAWTAGASCTVQVSPSSPYVFESWSDGSTENPRTFVAPSTNTTYSFTVTQTTGNPASIAANSGTPQSAAVGTAFANPLVALVEEATEIP